MVGIAELSERSTMAVARDWPGPDGEPPSADVASGCQPLVEVIAGTGLVGRFGNLLVATPFSSGSGTELEKRFSHLDPTTEWPRIALGAVGLAQIGSDDHGVGPVAAIFLARTPRIVVVGSVSVEVTFADGSRHVVRAGRGGAPTEQAIDGHVVSLRTGDGDGRWHELRHGAVAAGAVRTQLRPTDVEPATMLRRVAGRVSPPSPAPPVGLAHPAAVGCAARTWDGPGRLVADDGQGFDIDSRLVVGERPNDPGNGLQAAVVQGRRGDMDDCHFELRNQAGTVSIVDLGSVTGTWVVAPGRSPLSATRLDPFRPVPLSEGWRVFAGGRRFVLVALKVD